MSSGTYTNAYLLNDDKGVFTTLEPVGAPNMDQISASGGNTLTFGEKLSFNDGYNTITLKFDGPAYVNGHEIGFTAIDSQGDVFLFTDTTVPAGSQVDIAAGEPYTICFMAGTAIATPNGARAVETLAIGDNVVTADGTVQPVKWIGRQTIATHFADPLRVNPIRVRAGALGDNLPVRDLLISPDHALLVDGVLVQAAALVNGLSIVRETPAETGFIYYHVELADHSLILAEGVAAETFVDNVERMAFDNWAEHQALYPQGATVGEMELPRAKSHRQVPQSTRSRLLARAEDLFAMARAA